MALRLQLLRPTAIPPRYMSQHAAGADVFADLGREGASQTCFAGNTYRIPVGFAIAIPVGYVGLLKGRSGLASKGTEAHVAAIDPDYRGEVCVILHPGSDLIIDHGDRVGQLLIVAAPQYEFEMVDTLDATERGNGGFGHTGR